MPRPVPPLPHSLPPVPPPIPCAATAAPSPIGPAGCSALRPDTGDGAAGGHRSGAVHPDHLARPADGDWVHLLPPALDAALVDAGVKAKLGALSYNTVRHRLAVLAKWHGLKSWPSPTETAAVKTLLREARKAQARQGVSVRKTAAVREPLEAMLATCTDGVRGLRDRALLLLAWSGGGRRRSEVVGLQVGDVRQLDAATWLYALGVTKTETEGVRRESAARPCGTGARGLASGGACRYGAAVSAGLPWRPGRDGRLVQRPSRAHRAASGQTGGARGRLGGA